MPTRGLMDKRCRNLIVCRQIKALVMAISIETFTGAAIGQRLPILARLCTTVFREWPHLYDGDGSYDVRHLQTLADSPRAMLLIAYDADVAIGASTCLPLADATENVQAPFLSWGWPPRRFFYLAESVLLPKYRGRGVGKTFFAMREKHARTASDCDFSCFCTIQRPQDHPARPAGAVPLNAFWRGRGYNPVPDLHCRMAWREIGRMRDSKVTLVFWMKSLTDAELSQSAGLVTGGGSRNGSGA
jgi:GNAT superfamily N-acetyltransferase